MDDNYCIKPGYRSQIKALTIEENVGDYWNNWREAGAHSFQFYVYQTAFSYALKYQINSLLDIGCGIPKKLRYFFKNKNYRIVMIDQPTVKDKAIAVFPQGEFIGINIEKDDLYLDETFDLIICADVIEHLIDPDKLLNLIKKHIKQNGIIIISTVERDFLRGKHETESKKPEHVREWNSEEFHKYINSRGFCILAQHWFPQQKISTLEYQLSRFFPFTIWKNINGINKRWGGCQCIVATYR